MKALAIGGTADHVHLLISLPSTLSIAKAIQLIKGGSCSWVHESFSEHKDFQWQEGYGAFSVSISHLDKTRAYIKNQKEHHKTQTFQEEYLAFLKKHRIAYDDPDGSGLGLIQPSRTGLLMNFVFPPPTNKLVGYCGTFRNVGMLSWSCV